VAWRLQRGPTAQPTTAAWTSRDKNLIKTSCANRKDYLHCVLSLEKATTICTKCCPRDPRSDRGTSQRKRQDTIVNSRNALRNAQALAGLRASACVLPLVAVGDAPEHGKSEDHPDPGGSRV